MCSWDIFPHKIKNRLQETSGRNPSRVYSWGVPISVFGYSFATLKKMTILSTRGSDANLQPSFESTASRRGWCTAPRQARGEKKQGKALFPHSIRMNKPIADAKTTVGKRNKSKKYIDHRDLALLILLHHLLASIDCRTFGTPSVQREK